MWDAEVQQMVAGIKPQEVVNMESLLSSIVISLGAVGPPSEGPGGRGARRGPSERAPHMGRGMGRPARPGPGHGPGRPGPVWGAAPAWYGGPPISIPY